MANGVTGPAGELLRQSVKAERKLIAREAAAEKAVTKAAERLARAEDKLAKAAKRAERRRADLASAADELGRRQSERAFGPGVREEQRAVPEENDDPPSDREAPGKARQTRTPRATTTDQPG